MHLAGLQKLSLLDYPEKLCCTVFCAGCNLRCPYCHNASLVLPQRFPAAMSEQAFFDFLCARKGKLDAVCISGGEPLLQPGLEGFIRQIKALGFEVKLDTNGSLPQRLMPLLEGGLVDYVAMDIKATPKRYARAVGLPGYDPLPMLQSAACLLEGKVTYEFRTTLVQELHSPEDMHEIGTWLKGAQRFFLQGFVASQDMLCPGLHALPEEDMQSCLQSLRQYIPSAELRGI